MKTWLRRVAHLFRQSRHETDLREEIEAHRRLRAADLERQGLTPQQADEASRRAIGNALLAREDAREVWLGSWDSWWRDVRYGLRTLRRSPAFTAAAVTTLALGIGVNTGIFTVLNGVLFRDLPAPDAYELVSIEQTVRGLADDATDVVTFTLAEYETYRDGTRTLSGLLAHSSPIETTMGGEAPQRTYGAIVSCNYFEVLRQPPVLGRALTAQDCKPGAEPVVVLGHELWTSRYEAAPGAVGRTIELNGRLFTIVGVAAEGTYAGSPLRTGYFAPLGADPLLSVDSTRSAGEAWLFLIGRRAEEAGLDQVRAELAVIAAQIDRQQPGRSTVLSIDRATPMTVPPFLRGPATGAAAVLMAAFLSVLLIACANVAHLLLARGHARSQEMAIRLSLGAGRARVIRQLLTESLLLSLVGGVLGSVLAVWSFQVLVARALPTLLPPEMSYALPGWDSSPDVRVLWFAVVLTLGTAILFGLVPAVHTSTPDLHAVMKQAPAPGRARGGRLRGTLVAVQVALSMTLMIAAGLLLRGLHATHTIEPGFDYDDVAYVSFGLDGLRYEPEEAAIFRQRLRDEVSALAGVDAVAYASDPPLGEERAIAAIRLPGESAETARPAELNAVTSDYFSLVGISIVRGRTFTDAEIPSPAGDAATRPVVVSKATARNLWPEGNPIGRTLLWRQDASERDVALFVVGVAANAQVSTLGAIDPYYIYVPGGEELLLRTRGDFAGTAAGVRAIVRQLDPGLVADVLPLEANLGWWRGVSGTATGLAAGLGMLALVLAAVGIYGGVSYAVARRYREIGIRLALGARARGVFGLIVRQAMRPVVVGSAIGVVAASALSRMLSGVLFGVSPADPVGLGGGALLVLGVALAAAVMAARPVMRADPTEVLRSE